jgi:hypothetical protein
MPEQDPVALLTEVHKAALHLTALAEEHIPIAAEHDREWIGRFVRARTQFDDAWKAYQALPPGPERHLP